MRKDNKRTVVIATVLGILLISIFGYFAYDYYSDYVIKSVAEKYLNILDVSPTLVSLDDNVKQISTSDFVHRNLSDLDNALTTHKKINATVDKIILVDQRKSALEAEVFYTAHPSDETYSVPSQLNLVLYKEPTGWKVQDAYFMSRSDQKIPANSEIEQNNQVNRYAIYLKAVNQLLLARMNSDFISYSKLFSEKSDNKKYDQLFKDEQKYLFENKLRLSLVSNGLLVNSSTDLEAITTVLLTQSTEKGSTSMPLKLKFVYEKGEWRVLGIFS